MSWLSDRLGIHVNLRPLAAPAGAIVGGLLGGPLGAGIGAGLFKSSDNLAHGDSLGHALGQGALNGALAYGAGSLFNGAGGGVPGGPQVTPSASYIQGPGNAALRFASNTASSPVQQSVMQRVLGGASNVGNFVKNNKDTLETVGQGAEGVMNAAMQNKQASIQQQLANAQAAQIQAAIDKQKAVAAAFAQMYKQPLPGAQGAQGAQGGASKNFVPSSSTPLYITNPDDNPGDPGNPGPGRGGGGGGAPVGGPPTSPPGGDPKTTAAVMARLGYVPPSSPYAGNDSMYGSPFGYGYTSMGGF